MPSPANTDANAPIDPALVAEVVRRVVAQLGGGGQRGGRGGAGEVKPAGANERTDRAEPGGMAPERVISVSVIARVAGQATQLTIHPRAVVTPAARDEAKLHGITLVRGQSDAAAKGSSHSGSSESAAAGNPPAPITDTDHPERAEAIAAQLARRGVRGDAWIVLSDRPAAEVHRRSAAGERAVMIRCLADVDRFGAELRPRVWVLDMIELNLVAAVNVAARIIQTGGAAR